MFSGLAMLSAGAACFAGLMTLLKVIQARRQAKGKGPFGPPAASRDVKTETPRFGRRRRRKA